MTTNLERIRQMNSEELAIWKNSKNCLSCSIYKTGIGCFSDFDCKIGISEWLEKEVEE